jgi:arylsulfatase A-like enzyme
MAAAVLAVAGCSGTSAGPKPQASTPGQSPAPSAGRPNIVFVLTDDLSWNLVPYMPHVQAMEAEGSTFAHFSVVDSLCCPSRSAIFTGEYPHDDGVFGNSGADGGYGAFQAHHDASASFALALQKAGYRTGFMGKYLNGYTPSDPVPPGWDEWDVAGWGYREFNYQLNENGTIHAYGNQPKDYLTDVLSAKANSFIDDSAAAHKPFALEVATFAPHSPDVPAPRDAGTFPELRAPRTPAWDRLPTDPPAWLKRFPPLSKLDKSRIDWWFRRRVESVQAVDRMIGQLKATLRKDGVAGNTYFVFSSDNGYHLGEHRMRPGKETAFETDIRVPLMVTGPGVPVGRRDATITSSIDLAPTFDAIAGRPEPAGADGVSMLGLWHGRPAPADWQRAVLVEHHGPVRSRSDPDYQLPLNASPPSYEAVRTASALYVRYDRGGEEYYDVARDPYELHNIVATVPRARLQRMRTLLAALVHCHGHAQCQAAAASPASAGSRSVG